MSKAGSLVKRWPTWSDVGVCTAAFFAALICAVCMLVNISRCLCFLCLCGGGSLFSCACFFCVCVIRVEEADVDVWEQCHHRTPDAWVLKAADFHPACLSHVLDSVCAQVFASDDHMRTRTCVVFLKEQSLYMSVLINSTTPVVVNDLESNKSVQSSRVSQNLSPY